MKSCWHSLPCSSKQVNLDIALACGQSFRWIKNADGEWMGMIKDIPYLLKQDNEKISFQVIRDYVFSAGNEQTPITEEDQKQIKEEYANAQNWTGKQFAAKYKADFKNTQNDRNRVYQNREDDLSSKLTKQHSLIAKDVLTHKCNIRSYLQLDIDLEILYKNWKKADTNFKAICDNFQGIRMLRQDPVENLFSFICSQNNNIPRITSLVGKLCSTFGTKITELNGHVFYTFPSLEKLAHTNVEDRLRKLGFGYRAKFINQSAQYILNNHSKEWLYNLREVGYAEAHSEMLMVILVATGDDLGHEGQNVHVYAPVALCKLPGVGAKVADCVCLMSLDKTEAVPVDTHVWQIACKAYLPHLRKYKSITDKGYKEVGDHFRSIFGKYAGWAHSVLFSADLKKFKDLHQSIPKEVKHQQSEKISRTGRKRAAPETKKGSKRKK